MTYPETLDYLYNRLPVFHHIGAAAYKPGLDNTIRLMNALGNPHKHFKSIHIAGTNGKGSVSHMLAATLQSAGYKTALYTSPHLVHFGERIRINGQMIDEQYVIDFVEHHKELFESIQPSFFELTMAMAFCYFADSKVDVAVIEVGLGGRLDSTNIILPDLCVITNISFDHVGFLGDTLEKIAFEKAGIIKPGVPVVIGESLPETKPVFVGKARQEGAPIRFAEDSPVEFCEYRAGKMLVQSANKEIYCAELAGNYQLKNLASVLAAVDELRSIGYGISTKALETGISKVVELTGLQGRWQVVSEQPYTVLDTGHNKAGIACVVEQIASCRYEQLHIVIGMVNDKDISAVLNLLPKEARYYFTQAQIVRALAAEELQLQAKSIHLNGEVYNTVKEAIEAAQKNAESEDMIYIGGSNFVVGEALDYLQNSSKLI
jgi:dihydrofolate synthase/folylpolyglutamate synthase